METTVCPWCHTEIVWDEEFGPEENCPHCNNELSGYRTVRLGVDNLEDEEEEEPAPQRPATAPQEQAADDNDLWDDNDKDSVVPIFNTLDQFSEEYDMAAYAQNSSTLLALQEEAPECPQCHELMLLAGKQVVSAFEPSTSELLGGGPVLKAPFSLNVYVCPSCFHVQHNLAQQDRVQLVRNVTNSQQ